MAPALAGRTVAITRSEDDSEEFIRLARRDGATPVPLPTIELVSRGGGIVDEFLDSAGRYDPDYSVFMSSKAVRLLFETARAASRLDELRAAVSRTAVMAVGPKTRAALEESGIRVAHMPDTYSSVGVGELFTRLHAVGKRVIVPRSGASTPFLAQLLDKIGLDVRELRLYDVRASGDTSGWDGFGRLFWQGRVDGLVFTSASSVRAFFEIMDRGRPPERRLLDGLAGTNIVSIGPFTAAELRRLGVQNTVAQVHTVRGSFEAIRDVLLRGGTPAGTRAQT